jgi:hypothetical protein
MYFGSHVFGIVKSIFFQKLIFPATSRARKQQVVKRRAPRTSTQFCHPIWDDIFRLSCVWWNLCKWKWILSLRWSSLILYCVWFSEVLVTPLCQKLNWYWQMTNKDYSCLDRKRLRKNHSHKLFLVDNACHWKTTCHHGGFCFTTKFTSRAIKDLSLGPMAFVDQRCTTPRVFLMEKFSHPPTHPPTQFWSSMPSCWACWLSYTLYRGRRTGLW